jgi:hypothetical protein
MFGDGLGNFIEYDHKFQSKINRKNVNILVEIDLREGLLDGHRMGAMEIKPKFG